MPNHFKRKPCKYCKVLFSPKNATDNHCSTHCSFWAKVDKDNINGCWLWTASKSKTGGYGVFNKNGVRYKAHRFSYGIHHGHIPKMKENYHGVCVLHKCDNPSCVNPEHLFLGTQLDNIKDMKLKNRSYNRNGSKNPSAKLTEADVIEIREALNNGTTYRFLAEKHNVGQSEIGRIKKRTNWVHI